MNESLIDKPPPRCQLPGCKLPGRLVLGITDGAVTYWCIDHVDRGIAYFTTLTDEIRHIVSEHQEVRDDPS